MRDEFRRLLEREARLLDQLRYDDWLAMYAPECVYWVPSTPQAGDPRREIAIMFDDRRRLEDRVYRLRTGFAWSQAPASRTVRLITNVEVFATAERRRAHAALEFPDQRVLGRRNALAGRLGRAPRGPQRRRLEDPGQAGEPDRMRSVDPQSKHYFLGRVLTNRPASVRFQLERTFADIAAMTEFDPGCSLIPGLWSSSP